MSNINNPPKNKVADLNIKKDTWDVIDSYFKSNEQYLVKHHQDSFNDFINNKIPLTFEQYNPQILYKEFGKLLSFILMHGYKI